MTRFSGFARGGGNKETPIQTDILKYLNTQKDIEAFRLSNHAVAGMRNGVQFFRKDKWKMLGLADICFFCKGVGAGFIEVKSKGGTLSTDQKIFKFNCELYGVPFFMADNVSQIETEFKKRGWIK